MGIAFGGCEKVDSGWFVITSRGLAGHCPPSLKTLERPRSSRRLNKGQNGSFDSPLYYVMTVFSICFIITVGFGISGIDGRSDFGEGILDVLLQAVKVRLSSKATSGSARGSPNFAIGISY